MFISWWQTLSLLVFCFSSPLSPSSFSYPSLSSLCIRPLSSPSVSSISLYLISVASSSLFVFTPPYALSSHFFLYFYLSLFQPHFSSPSLSSLSSHSFFRSPPPLYLSLFPFTLCFLLGSNICSFFKVTWCLPAFLWKYSTCCQCCKTFHGRNLRIFIISWSVCSLV